MKVRGTAMHVAEKYMSLARDALASGDNVAAENYLQHAEHYNRIVAAAQLQQQQMQPPQFREPGDDDVDEDRAPRGRDRFGYYTDPEGEEDGFDTGVGDEDDRGQPQNSQPQQQRPAPRQDFRGQDNRDGRGDGGPNRQDRPGYQGDRPRRDNRDRDNFREGRNDNRDARPDNRDGRSDFRDGRNDNRHDRSDNRYERGDNRNGGRNDRFNGERPRQEFRDAANEGAGRPLGADTRPYGDEPRSDAVSGNGAQASAPQRSENTRDEAPARNSSHRPAQLDAEAPEDGISALHAGSPDSAPAEDIAPRPRRRRVPRVPKEETSGAASAEPDVTRDGEAALAAFPD